MEYTLVIGGMCMGELANTYDVIENRMLTEVDRCHHQVEAQDIEMEEVQDQLWDFNMQVSEVEERVGAAERLQDILDAFVKVTSLGSGHWRGRLGNFNMVLETLL